ncbi:hypothetical protein GOP47_0010517 [Adiantum capillus-veneris]|uniref:Uncharacterized protein n=1 Tax=Adiantum capillus-veneris TaxID=13818 RepID=A0A9D4UV61_ADICA|nr:hypothetical protein GOP47_0010517 [Adiantum capillus-veneris]
MINWLCGAPPARPPHSAAVKASVTDHHASVVSITGITPICSSKDNGGRGDRGALIATFGFPSGDIEEHGTTHPASPKASSPIRGVGILIHPTLVLTTHSTIPSPHCIKDAEITFCRDVSSLTYIKRKFVPDIFFETNVELDLTVVSCEIVAPDLSYSLPLDTTKLRRRAIRKDHPIFIMGCQVRKPDDIVIMEGCISGVVRSEPLQNNVFLRFQTAGDEIWMPGTAGFDEFGSFAFIVTKSPAKLQEDMQSPSFKLNNEQVGIVDSYLSPDRSQASPISARFFGHKRKQWATCVQAIKEWVQPLWKENRNEVFEGSMQPLKLAKQLRRPSTPGDALFRQKSFTPRNSISTIAEGHSPLCGKTGNDVEKADITAQELAGSSREMKVEPSPSPCMEESSGVQAMVPASADQHREPDVEMEKAHPPKRAITYKQRLSKNIVFTALSKQNNGLKKLTQRAIKSKKTAMESVSVQTTTPPDVEKELPDEFKDPNPVVSIRRASEESAEAGVRSEFKKTNGGREKWSLPGELDPIVKKSESKQPGLSKGSNAIGSSAKRGMQSQRPGASAWIDTYYSLGRSRSDHRLKFSRPGLSSASTSTRDQRDIPLAVDGHLFGADKDYGYDTQVPEDNPTPNMQRSLSSPASSVYNKPTISYMQRRSLNQREQLARRVFQSSNSPRWS